MPHRGVHIAFLSASLLLIPLVLLSQTGRRPTPPQAKNAAPFPTVLERCLKCHGGDKPDGGLNLTSRALALKGGMSGPAFQVGSAEKSRLFQRIQNGTMPPGNPLTKDEEATVRAWLTAGAPWPSTPHAATRAGKDWWSLRKVVLPAPPRPPKGKDGGGLAVRQLVNPIDAFVLDTLRKHGLHMAPPADRTTLLRRVTYDLIGLPPTPQEIDAFLADRSPNAYEKVVDRLLTDPHYGERWGRHWLDVARFGESNGFERDQLRPNAWRYRDYVIRAFNQDKPYDQFIREQIAGDVIEPRTHDGVLATGFLVGGSWDDVGNNQVSVVMRTRVREEELEEMVGTVSQTFLGMTVNCARCHDHKFDPIPQMDYYHLKAALEGVHPGDRDFATPEETRLREVHAAQITQQIRELRNRIGALESAAQQRLLPTDNTPTKGPVPIAQWTFETDTRDVRGHLAGTLIQGAHIQKGRLILDAEGAYLRSAPLPNQLREKTLEAWVSLPRRDQRGGGVLTVQTADGGQFDAIVFGEREPGRWGVGSDSFRRTRDLNGAEETAKPNELTHMAVAYGPDNRITVYRNGTAYAAAYTPAGDNASLRTFPAGRTEVLIGLRHTGAGNGFLKGEIEEARLYDRALSPEEIVSSYRVGPTHLSESALLEAMTPVEREQRSECLAACKKAEAELKQIAEPERVYAAAPVQPQPTCLLMRGDVESKGPEVAAGGLSCLSTPLSDWGLRPDAPEGLRRQKLAQWIASPQNPLTARVFVNRIWHYHFGRGLVATPNDFGFNGDRPSHPELLDWLAATFVSRESRVESRENGVPSLSTLDSGLSTHFNFGWSLKKLHRLILLSDTYRQSSRYDARAAKVDSEARWLWRFPPQRLEGEAVRDAMLSVSGELNPQQGGPSFQPFKVVVDNSSFYIPFDSPAPEYNRRTIYRMLVQSAKNPLLETLDCPDPSTKTPRRAVTTTPLQALALMNNTFVQRQAHSFAARLKREAGAEPDKQVGLAYRLALGRRPTPQETIRATALVRQNDLESLCWALFNTSEFLYVR